MPTVAEIAQGYPGFTVQSVGADPTAVDQFGKPRQGAAVLILTDGAGNTRRVSLATDADLTTKIPNQPIDLNTVDFTITDQGADPAPGESKEEKVARVGASEGTAESARANAAKLREELATLQKDNAKRAENQQRRGLFMTDQEIAAMDAKLRDQGQNQQQIDNALKIAGDNNRQAAISNEIAATNATTAATRAAQDAMIAEKRLALDSNKNASDADLRQAQLDFDKENADLNRDLARDKLALDSLVARQTNDVAQAGIGVQQGNLAVSQGSAAETARSNQAREQQAKDDAAARAAESQRTSETAERTAAINAASSLYSTERTAQSQAGTTGANMLNQRVESAQGMLNNVLGLAGQGQSSSGKFGPLGGGLHAMPAGFDATQLLQGIQGYTTQLGGGQQVYDAAANMVKSAGADIQSPQGQAAYGVLGQMLERWKALTGQDHPAAAAAGAAAATSPAAGVASPPAAAAAAPAAAGAPAAMGGAVAAAPFVSPNQAQPSVTPQAAPVGLAAGGSGTFGITPEMAAQFQAGRAGQGPFVSPPQRTVTITV
jgi:hypothetical protein